MKTCEWSNYRLYCVFIYYIKSLWYDDTDRISALLNPLCGESTDYRWFPGTQKVGNVCFYCFFVVSFDFRMKHYRSCDVTLNGDQCMVSGMFHRKTWSDLMLIYAEWILVLGWCITLQNIIHTYIYKTFVGVTALMQWHWRTRHKTYVCNILWWSWTL